MAGMNNTAFFIKTFPFEVTDNNIITRARGKRFQEFSGQNHSRVIFKK